MMTEPQDFQALVGAAERICCDESASDRLRAAAEYFLCDVFDSFGQQVDGGESEAEPEPEPSDDEPPLA